ncbi:MAG: AIR carboxylase family protein [Patescibacteria group bacterium]
MFVPILLGSDSDTPHAEKIAAVLKEFGIPYEIRVLSAHKVPELLIKYIEEKNKDNGVVYVTIAGRSNGLSGVTAGSSIHPVIACPPFADKDDYMVNINSTLQMPSDTPVLTVLDPVNCALTIARIFGLSDEKIRAQVSTRIARVKSKFA